MIRVARRWPATKPSAFGKSTASLTAYSTAARMLGASHRWPTPPSASSRPLRLPVNPTGKGLALTRGLLTKHAIKQVDRLLSNQGIDIDAAPRHFVPDGAGPRATIKLARG